jgi:Uma2 family endonuclease
MAVHERLYTASDLSKFLDDDRRFELVRGELIVMPPVKRIHGLIANWIAYLLTGFVHERNLGQVIAEAGYLLEENPDTVRAPDVSFIAKSRVAPLTGDYDRTPPDLVVEVASPGNTTSDMNDKIEQYFKAGVRLIWVLYPNTRTVYVYTSARQVRILGIEDTLDGGDVLPDFSIAVRDIFSVLDR